MKNRGFESKLEDASDLFKNCKLDGSGLVYDDSEVEEEGFVERRCVRGLDDFRLLGLVGDGDLDGGRDVAARELTTFDHLYADLEVDGLVACVRINKKSTHEITPSN